MRKLLIKLSIFSLPIGFILGPSLFFLMVGGELLPQDWFVYLHAWFKRPLVYGLAYSDVAYYLKFQSTIYRKPEILALGSSRVLNFRSEFFNEPEKFYNAGLGIRALVQYRLFFDKAPKDWAPKVLIIGMEDRYFNPKWEDLSIGPKGEGFVTPENALNIISRQWRTIRRDYFELNKFSLHDVLFGRSPLTVFGYNGLIRTTGYVNDGSLYYGSVILKPEDPKSYLDWKFDGMVDLVKTGHREFGFAETPLEGAFQETEKLLDYLKSRGVHVIAIMPPFAPRVWKTMIAMKEHSFIKQIAPRLKPMYEKRGFSFFDFSDVSYLGMTDGNFVDGNHGSERVYGNMFLEMIKKDPVLAKIANASAVRKQLLASKSAFELFPLVENGHSVSEMGTRHYVEKQIPSSDQSHFAKSASGDSQSL